MKWPIRRFKVEGDSMEPAVKNGSFVVVNQWATPKRGDLVVCRHPREHRLMIKRVVDFLGEMAVVQGDNSAQSIDSRSFGPISKESILGRVILCTKY